MKQSYIFKINHNPHVYKILIDLANEHGVNIDVNFQRPNSHWNEMPNKTPESVLLSNGQLVWVLSPSSDKAVTIDPLTQLDKVIEIFENHSLIVTFGGNRFKLTRGSVDIAGLIKVSIEDLKEVVNSYEKTFK